MRKRQTGEKFGRAQAAFDEMAGWVKKYGAAEDRELTKEPGMERHHPGRFTFALLLLLLTASCSPPADLASLDEPEQVLARAGRRLSGLYSANELTTIATSGQRVLEVLESDERDALARGCLRFQVDRPVEVMVAVRNGSEPFWLTDLGFVPAGLTVSEGPGERLLWRGRYPAGWVGLGVNGLDRTADSHYAVFVTSTDGQPVSITHLKGEGWETAEAHPGVPLERDSSIGLGDVPDVLAGSTLFRRSRELRHSAMLARGRVWKTHEVSSPRPDQVVISFGADPTSELSFSWRTGPEVKAGAVRLRPAGGGVERHVVATSEPVSLPDLLNDPLILRHKARVSGLKAGQAYEYSLGSEQPAQWTRWETVRTVPASASKVSLLYMGDPQCGLEGWGKLLAAAYRRRPDAQALLIAGDLVDRGNERTNWDHFFLRATGVFEKLPLMPAAGNHEYLDRGPWLYRSFFALPANGPADTDPGLVYHFELGDAFVAVLDSTAAVSDPREAQRQARWLDGVLAATTRTWKLVMFHHPLYASHPRRESPELRETWATVLERHRVDLVLQGHDHAYLRTYPLRGGLRSPEQGTVYLVSVSGDKFYDQDPRDYTEVGFTHVSTYQTIDIDADRGTLSYHAIDVNGREHDAFILTKPAKRNQYAGRDEGVRRR